MNKYLLLSLSILSLKLLSFGEVPFEGEEKLLDINLVCLEKEGIRLNGNSSEEEILFFLACARLDIPQIKNMLEKNPTLSSIQDADQKTPLHFLIERKNGPQLFEVAKLILAQKNILEACDSDGKTPLCYACDCENWDMVDLLLAYGAEVNIEISDGIPLHTLIRKEKIDLIKIFIEKGAKDLRDQYYFFSLHHACEEGKIDVVKFVLKKLYRLKLKSFKNSPSLGKEFNRKIGYTDNSHDVLSCAVRCKNFETTRLLLKYHIAEISSQHLLLPTDSQSSSFDIFKEVVLYMCNNGMLNEDIVCHFKKTIFVYYNSNKKSLKNEFYAFICDLIEIISIDSFEIHEEDSYHTKKDLEEYNQFVRSLKKRQIETYKVALEETGFKRARENNEILPSNKIKKKI